MKLSDREFYKIMTNVLKDLMEKANNMKDHIRKFSRKDENYKKQPNENVRIFKIHSNIDKECFQQV